MESRVFAGVPAVPEHAAAKWLAEVFGQTGTLAPLPSERDVNYRVDVEGRSAYVLKVANRADSPDLIAAQHGALACLEAAGVPFDFPAPLPTLAGSDVAMVEDAEGARCMLRLMRFVPGGVAGPDAPRPWANPMLESVGVMAGWLHRALAGFDHPALHRPFKWDLRHAVDTVSSRRSLISDRGRLRLLDACLARLGADYRARVADLPEGVIHNDMNDYNLVVTTDQDGPRVSGLIDFGDMIYSVEIAELAVACAYALLEHPDPLQAIATVTAAYDQVTGMRDEERSMLPRLATARLAMSVAIAAEQQAADPGNAYLGISEAPAWSALDRMASIDLNATIPHG